MNEQELQVSVLMTVYNGEKTIHESINAVLSQTHANFEFVIVDDGSTDKSNDIIKKYADLDSRIIFVERKENKGRSFSLNEGLECCKGRYIAINDADDISYKNRIEIICKFIKENGIDDLFGVVGSANINEDRINNTFEKYYPKTGSLSMQVTRNRLFFGMPFIHSSFFYQKKALLDVGGFATEVTAGIDYLTLLKISKFYPIFACPEITVVRIKDGNNYFLTPKIEQQKQSNIKVINAWQKENYKLYPALNCVRKILKK